MELYGAPRGVSADSAWLSLPALGLAGVVRKKPAHALHLLVLALGMLLPAMVDTFLVNRLRYLWPFATGWLVGVAVLTWLLGRAVGLFLVPRAASEKVRQRPSAAWPPFGCCGPSPTRRVSS